jgi:hypothetical protein
VIETLRELLPLLEACKDERPAPRWTCRNGLNACFKRRIAFERLRRDPEAAAALDRLELVARRTRPTA